MDDKFKNEVIVRLDSIDANLERHMRRSDAIEAQVEPLKKMAHEFIGAVKVLKLILTLAAVAELIRLIWSWGQR